VVTDGGKIRNKISTQNDDSLFGRVGHFPFMTFSFSILLSLFLVAGPILFGLKVTISLRGRGGPG